MQNEKWHFYRFCHHRFYTETNQIGHIILITWKAKYFDYIGWHIVSNFRTLTNIKISWHKLWDVQYYVFDILSMSAKKFPVNGELSRCREQSLKRTKTAVQMLKSCLINWKINLSAFLFNITFKYIQGIFRNVISAGKLD